MIIIEIMIRQMLFTWEPARPISFGVGCAQLSFPTPTQSGPDLTQTAQSQAWPANPACPANRKGANLKIVLQLAICSLIAAFWGQIYKLPLPPEQYLEPEPYCIALNISSPRKYSSLFFSCPGSSIPDLHLNQLFCQKHQIHQNHRNERNHQNHHIHQIHRNDEIHHNRHIMSRF